ncbi:MAG: HD domain-containing protein [Bdellovibrionota bacterium]
MKTAVLFILLLTSLSLSRANADHLTLCNRLLMAYSEDSIQIPVLWTKIELALRAKIRTGWVKRGIPEEIAETVLEHSQKVRRAALYYSIHHAGIDVLRAGFMALIHDLAEAIAPDFTPDAKITKAEKHAMEKRVWDEIVLEIPEAAPLRELWMEYEAAETPTAKLVKQLDKLDAAIQALKYEKLGHENVVDFYPDARKKLSDPTLVKILDLLLEKKFPLVNIYDQYFTLLKVNGDKVAFEMAMEEKTQQVLRTRNEAKGL